MTYTHLTTNELVKVIPSDFGFMISIENSIKYQEKFTNLDISASLGKYIVDTSYMTDDQSSFIYELDDPTQDRRFNFSSLQGLKNVQIDKYKIPVDKQLSFELCHNLCVGATGSGKSYWLYYYVIALLSRFGKDSLYICDPKNSSMAIIGEKIGHVAITKEESLELLREFHQQMQERKQKLSDLLKSGLDKDYRDFNLPPRVLIFDEYANQLTNSRANRRFKLICDTLLASALRISELLALEITDLDFETGEIIVSKTVMWKPGNKKLGLKGKGTLICS